ncbi:MAG: hypothetical protein H0T73_12930 [Ardenticatenales bacterium]|nr:hypothetical protein [Ardenticatenales bacterium]
MAGCVGVGVGVDVAGGCVGVGVAGGCVGVDAAGGCVGVGVDVRGVGVGVGVRGVGVRVTVATRTKRMALNDTVRERLDSPFRSVKTTRPLVPALKL